MRIVAIQHVEQWVGSLETEEYLEVPDTMDIAHEEEQWFAVGGGTPADFVAHLMAKGATKFSIETWIIRYQ